MDRTLISSRSSKRTLLIEIGGIGLTQCTIGLEQMIGLNLGRELTRSERVRSLSNKSSNDSDSQDAGAERFLDLRTMVILMRWYAEEKCETV